MNKSLMEEAGLENKNEIEIKNKIEEYHQLLDNLKLFIVTNYPASSGERIFLCKESARAEFDGWQGDKSLFMRIKRRNKYKTKKMDNSLVAKDHVILSAENSPYKILSSFHNEMLELLSRVSTCFSVEGCYGKKENSIFVSTPDKFTYDIVHVLCGTVFHQESIIVNEKNMSSRLVYLNGEKKGKYHPAKSLSFLLQEPKDFYTKYGPTNYFTYDFDWDNLIENNKAA